MKKTVSFSKNSTNVFFHILTKCNLKCRHCYINPEHHGKETLSISVIDAWLKEFAGKSSESNVIFLGGEPTLHPDLPLAVKKARKMGYNSITIDTNGYLFHDFIEKVLPEDLDYISFSLDGATKETNDMIRGSGSFDICTSGIRKAISKGFNTSLIYTVSSLNIHELEMMVPFVKKLGINRLFIQVLGIRGKSVESQSDMFQVSRERWASVVPSVAEKIADSGIIVSYPKVFLDIDEQFECAGVVADNYFIFPNGRVYRCPLCEDFSIHSMAFENNKIVLTEKINENDFFQLQIPEGCVMNKIIQPDNLTYTSNGSPEYKIACCLLKEEISN